MLEHDHVPLIGAVLHFCFKSGAQSIQWVSARSYLLIGEETNPAKPIDDSILFCFTRKCSGLGDGINEIPGNMLESEHDMW